MVDVTAILATGWRITDWRLYQAIEDFEAADHAWSMELDRLFGRDAGDVRYTYDGRGDARSHLRSLYLARDAARLEYDAAWERYRGGTVWINFGDGIGRSGKPFPVDVDEVPPTGDPTQHARDVALADVLPGLENADDFKAAVAALMGNRSYRVGGGAAPLYEIRRAAV